MSSSKGERDEQEERAERDSRWDLVPAAVREPRRERQRVDILAAYPDDEFRQMFR